MDRNNVRPIPVSINTKFLNCLQPEWSKYVTMVRHNQTGDTVSYDELYDSLPHANSSYSSQPYYVIHPSSVANYEDEYQGELQGDSQEDKLTTAMMLLARAITQKFFTPTNNCYGGNGDRNAGRQNRNQTFNAGTRNDKSHYARDCQKPIVHNAKYFREQMLLAMKDEAGSNLKDEENDFMLDNSYEDETLEELTVAVIMMA
ncbi:hypothetical protein Tco_1352646 [Tanacetum coccineum]